MVIRIVFALMIIVVLLPHEPNLGLPAAPQQPFAQILSAIRDTVTTRASRAVGELRRYDNAASSRQAAHTES